MLQKAAPSRVCQSARCPATGMAQSGGTTDDSVGYAIATPSGSSPSRSVRTCSKIRPLRPHGHRLQMRRSGVLRRGTSLSLRLLQDHNWNSIRFLHWNGTFEN
ncbi:hypothetical protein SEVIR_9G526750v4 [Setaria viridis]